MKAYCMCEIQCAMTRSVFPGAPGYEPFRGKSLGKEQSASLTEAIQPLTTTDLEYLSITETRGQIMRISLQNHKEKLVP